jgi:hypothetical protein
MEWMKQKHYHVLPSTCYCFMNNIVSKEYIVKQVLSYTYLLFWCPEKLRCLEMFKTERNRNPLRKPDKTKLKMLLGLIESVHGRLWKVQVTDHAPKHRLQQNSTCNHDNGEILNLEDNGEILNLETSADLFIGWLLWNLQCDTFVSFHDKRRMVPE